jgi:hypothetical protein
VDRLLQGTTKDLDNGVLTAFEASSLNLNGMGISRVERLRNRLGTDAGRRRGVQPAEGLREAGADGVLSATLHDFGSPRLLTSFSRAARE